MFKLCVVCVFVIYRIVGQQSRGFLPKNIDVEKTGTCTRSIIDSTHDSQTKQKQRGKKIICVYVCSLISFVSVGTLILAFRSALHSTWPKGGAPQCSTGSGTEGIHVLKVIILTSQGEVTS